MRGSTSRHVYVFTLISYVFMFATLLTTGGVFLYKTYIKNQLNLEVAALDASIADFNQTDMLDVLDFDRRLAQAGGRLEKSISMASVFKTLEEAVVDTVQINSLSIEREEDEKFILSADITTDSYDSTLSQRGVFLRSQIIDSTSVQDVKRSVDGVSSNNTDELSPSSESVTFKVDLEIPLSEVPYTADDYVPVEDSLEPVEFIVSDAEDMYTNEEDNLGVNEENI